MTAVQLQLDLGPLTSGPPVERELFPYRHQPHELADHQRGSCVVPWDTGGAWKAGHHIPAWVCCKCGRAEPTEFTLQINHACWSPFSTCPTTDHWPLVTK